MLFSSDGKAVRFEEGDVRPMGRQATGVRGMRLGEGQRVVCMLAAHDESKSVADRDRARIRQAHENRRISAPRPRRPGRDRDPDFRAQRQGGSARCWSTNHDEVMLISTGGVLIRTKGVADPRAGPFYARRDAESPERRRKTRRPERIEERELEATATAATAKPPRSRRRRPPARPCIDVAYLQFQRRAGNASREVLARAGDEMLDWHGSGMCVMEMSHRGKEFVGIAADAERDLRELLAVPQNYKCCSCRAARRCSSPRCR